MQKIIGAHNTMTGATPNNYASKLFPAFCQCQNKSVEELAKAGVTCYDLRPCYDEDGFVQWRHGLARYWYKNYGFFGVIRDIQNFHNIYNSGKPLYVRLILEHPRNNGRELFKESCATVEKEFPDILFFEGRDKHTWEKLYTFKRESEVPTVTEYHASVSGTGLLKAMPRLFWRLRGKEYELQEGINLIDFI